MLVSDMAGQIDRYMRDRALFNSDIQNKAMKWGTNYVHPLAVGYRAAQNRLNKCVSDAQTASSQREIAYQMLKARIDLATGIVFALIGPFNAAAIRGLQSTQAELEDKILTRWYNGDASKSMNFDTLLTRETIRQRVLNFVADRSLSIGMQQAGARTSPAASDPASGSSRDAPKGVANVGGPSGFTLPEALLSGEFAPAEFEQNVQNVFNGFAVELHDQYLRLFDGAEADKRDFLVRATKSTLACPPPKPVTDTIPVSVLEAQLFGLIAGSYIFSYRPSNGRIWPSIGYDLASSINAALAATGNSMITNNPKLGAYERYDERAYVWDGTVQPNAQGSKIREINRGNAAVLEAYMQAISASNATT